MDKTQAAAYAARGTDQAAATAEAPALLHLGA